MNSFGSLIDPRVERTDAVHVAAVVAAGCESVVRTNVASVVKESAALVVEKAILSVCGQRRLAGEEELQMLLHQWANRKRRLSC